MKMEVKYQRKVLEIGFGDAKKLGELTRNPSVLGVGVEVPENVGKIDSIRRNLILSHQGAETTLVRMRSSSYDEVRMDLMLFEDFRATRWRAAVPLAEENYVPEYMFINTWKYPAVQHVFDKFREIILTQVKRVLKPEGRLVIHTFQEYTPRLQELLNKAGFAYAIRPATQKEIEGSSDLKLNAESSGNKDDVRIMHVEAWDKDRKPKLLPPPK